MTMNDNEYQSNSYARRRKTYARRKLSAWSDQNRRGCATDNHPSAVSSSDSAVLVRRRQACASAQAHACPSKPFFQFQGNFGLPVFVSPIDAAVIDGALHIKIGNDAFEGKARHTDIDDIDLLIVFASPTQK